MLPNRPRNLTQRALVATLRFQLLLAVLIFVPAWSLRFWQGWAYWLIFLAAVLAITLYFLRHDPALVERRMKAGPKAEREAGQKLIQTLASVAICTVLIVSALDHRFGWSSVPLWAVVAGDVLVLLGFAIAFRVMRENSFASAIIEVSEGQTVVATGPYALVRHPMYAGSLLIFLGTPPALGSWWGLLPAALLTSAIVWRLLAEEAYLARNLPGYEDYRRRVAQRLIPGVW